MQKKTRSRLLALQIVGNSCLSNLKGFGLGLAQNTASFSLPKGSQKSLSQASGRRNQSHRHSFRLWGCLRRSRSTQRFSSIFQSRKSDIGGGACFLMQADSQLPPVSISPRVWSVFHQQPKTGTLWERSQRVFPSLAWLFIVPQYSFLGLISGELISNSILAGIYLNYSRLARGKG